MASSSALRKTDSDTEFSTGENFAELFEQQDSSSVAEGSVVKGTIVALEKDLAVIDVGLKSEGRIPLKEFGIAGRAAEVRIGDVYDISCVCRGVADPCPDPGR